MGRGSALVAAAANDRRAVRARLAGGEWLDADVVGAGPQVFVHSGQYGSRIAPGDRGVHQTVAIAAGQIVSVKHRRNQFRV